MNINFIWHLGTLTISTKDHQIFVLLSNERETYFEILQPSISLEMKQGQVGAIKCL